MNKETIKAIKEKEKNVTNIKKWWSRNRYKIMKCIFFPVWFAQLANEKIQRSLNAKIEWSEERAKEIFDYYIPRKSEWDKENKELYFFDNGYGWNMCLAKKYLKKKIGAFGTFMLVVLALE